MKESLLGRIQIKGFDIMFEKQKNKDKTEKRFENLVRR